MEHGSLSNSTTMKTKHLLSLFLTLWMSSLWAYDFEKDGIYYNITSLQDLTVEVTYGENDYSGDIVIPSFVEYANRNFLVNQIGDRAFSSSARMTGLIIPNTVVSIGVYAFSFCQSLTSLSIPSSVTTILKGAFSGCYSLADLKIEDGDDFLFIACKEFQVNNYASFDSCPLETIYIGRDIGSSGASDYQAMFYNKTDLNQVSIGPKVTQIGGFVCCSNLQEIVIPSNVKTISSYAFQNCANLKKITLNEGLQLIESSAFTECTSVHALFIPSTVTSIQSCAFEQCKNITKVFSKAVIPADLQENAFPGIVYLNATLYVPFGSKVVYESTNGWKDFCTIIETSSFEEVAVDNISLSQGMAALEVNDTLVLTASIEPLDATDKSVSWASGDSNVATVDSNGIVSAVGTGSTTITATANDGSGKIASCIVTVSAPSSIDLIDSNQEQISPYSIDGSPSSSEDKGLIIQKYNGKAKKVWIK